MYFRQILNPDLGCASYLIADRGEAAVIDPKWAIEEYLAAAAEAGAEIHHVLETHTHADHVSGRRRIEALTGATVHAPAGPHRPRVRDGYTVRIGDLELVALATPGHRPEHVAYIVCQDGLPRHLLSGDSLLVGDIARPDLAVAADDGSHALWYSLKRIVALGDHVELWPGHVGGSLCASRSASSATSSTIGEQRRQNPLLALRSEPEFTAQLTGCIPARPPTMRRALALNVDGAPDPGPLRELDPGALARLFDDEVCVLDVRDPPSFDAGHLAGALNLASGGAGFGTRAGWAAGDESTILLVVGSLEQGRVAGELLRSAGIWGLAALTIGNPQAWRAAGLPVRTSAALDAPRLLEQVAAGTVTLVDVRDGNEWDAGHVEGAHSLPLAQLGDGRDLSASGLDSPLAVVCAGGRRAALAASILRRSGREPVWRVSVGVEQLAGLGAAITGRSEER